MFRMVILFCALSFSAFAKQPVRVYVDMVGDLFHPGHIDFLRKAKAEGDYLIVGVHPDELVESYKRRPILTLEERVRAISACRYVDEVIAGSPLPVTKEWIEKYKIDLVIHGDDFSLEQAKDHYGDPIELGIFKMVPYTSGISTSNIIQRILDRDATSLLKKEEVYLTQTQSGQRVR